MSGINQRTDVKWSKGLAIGVLDRTKQVQGVLSESDTEALAFLIASEDVWGLKFKRLACVAIEHCIINRLGVIDWYELDLLTSRARAL